jgi:hypothetical protein
MRRLDAGVKDHDDGCFRRRGWLMLITYVGACLQKPEAQRGRRRGWLAKGCVLNQTLTDRMRNTALYTSTVHFCLASS